MAIWDFQQMLGEPTYTGGIMEDIAGVTAPAMPNMNAGQQPQGWFDKMFGDPNNLRMMGEFASAYSQGKPFGQASGDAAAANARRAAMQNAGAKTGENQQNLLQQLLQAIVGDDPRKLVGPKEDTNSFDSLTIGPDGGFTIKAPGNKRPKMEGQQQDLESMNGGGSPF